MTTANTQEFTVVLFDVGSNSIRTVKNIRENTGLSLVDSKRLLDKVRFDNQPTTIFYSQSETKAVGLAVLMAQDGATLKVNGRIAGGEWYFPSQLSERVLKVVAELIRYSVADLKQEWEDNAESPSTEQSMDQFMFDHMTPKEQAIVDSPEMLHSILHWVQTKLGDS